MTSNPTARVVALLDHLAAHPDQSFGLSELSRDLRMNKSTCLTILGTLTEAGYLIQHPTRRDYRLGPALVTAGRAAMSRFPDLSVAQRGIAACAADVGSPIRAVTLADDQIVVLETMGGSDPFRGVARVGTRLPFTPPYGAGFVAWGDPDLWSRWLGRAAPALTDDQVANLRASIVAANTRGFLVSLEIAVEHQLHGTLEQIRHSARQVDIDQLRELAAARMRDLWYFLDDIDPDATYEVNLLQAPVLPSPRRSPLSLMAAAFGRKMTGEQINAAGQRLIDTCRDVARLVSES